MVPLAILAVLLRRGPGRTSQGQRLVVTLSRLFGRGVDCRHGSSMRSTGQIGQRTDGMRQKRTFYSGARRGRPDASSRLLASEGQPALSASLAVISAAEAILAPTRRNGDSVAAWLGN